MADDSYPVGSQPEPSGCGDPDRDGYERCRSLGPESFNPNQNGYHDSSDEERQERCLWKVADDREQVMDEAAFIEMDSKQFGDLIQDDDKAHPRFETRQHRF